MFKNILVPTDGSDYSHRAMEKAVALAKLTGAKIFLLHVVFTPETMGYMLAMDAGVIQEKFFDNGETVLREATSDIDLTGITIEKKAMSGHPAAQIIHQIEELNIDLVVMGSNGHGPILGPLLGSVSQKVVAQAKCPVLVVK